MHMSDLKADKMDELIASAQGNPEIMALLLSESSRMETSALSLNAPRKMTVAEFNKIWTYQELTDGKTGERFIELHNYKGTEPHVWIPAMLGKKPVRSVCGEFPDFVTSVELESPNIVLKCKIKH